MKFIATIFVCLLACSGCGNIEKNEVRKASKPSIQELVSGRTSEQDKKSSEFRWPDAPGWDYFINLMKVSDQSAPNKVLLKWGPKSSEQTLVDIDEDTLRKLLSSTQVFDCSPYNFDENLKLALRNAPSLKWLRVGERTDSEDLHWIGDLKHLKGLSLARANLNDADLMSLRNLQQLRWLDLNYVNQTNLPFSDPADFVNLEVLSICGKSTTDDQLPKHGQFPSLRVLCITSASISDEGVRRIVAACPKLRFLHLGRIKEITPACAVELKKLKELKYVYIGHTNLAVRDVILDLQYSMPNCYVSFGD